MVGLAVVLSILEAGVSAGDASNLEFFEKRIRPLLAENCLPCHGPAKRKAGLRLDHISTILAGGDNGPALVRGDPTRSRMIRAVEYGDPDLQMPPKGKLPAEKIAALRAWVEAGAVWPQEPPPPPTAQPSEPARVEAFDLERRKREHWSWGPIRPVEPPAVKRADWPRGDVDRFILSKLEEKGIEPAPPADGLTLLRRAYFDLIGLPPPAEEVDAFARGPSREAFEALVDRLLDSPRFGERWARRWLDLVRYAETLGHEFDYPVHGAWRYRDYVIRAFNADLPYDQFVIEHIAGDTLDPPRRHPVDGTNESILATAFLWFGQEVHSPVDVRQHEADRVENQVDVLAKTFLGLTVACARCHDHKFDAISTRDYYAFYGIVGSSRYTQASIDPPERILAPASRLEALKEEIRAVVDAEMTAAALSTAATTPQASPEGYELFADFTGPGWEGWFPDGAAFARPPDGRSELLLSGSEESLQATLLPGGWAHSALLSRRLQGALRSPSFTIEKRFVHVRAAGRQSRINVVIDGYRLIRDPIYGALKRGLDGDAAKWITFDLERWKGRRCTIELSDIAIADPAGDGYSPDGSIAVERVLFSERPVPPAAAASPEPPILRLALGSPAAGGAGRPRLAALWREYRVVEASIPAPTYAPATIEGTGHDERVFIRGSPKNLGAPAPRRFLEAIAGADQPVFGQPIFRPDGGAGSGPGSGRSELARRLIAPENPFPARVMANRIWHHLFGSGIVASPDDFGRLGSPPSHPELLDWLADRFRRDGWSMKRLIKLLMTSRAYQMASTAVSPAAEEADPTNALLHRMPVRRLDAEAIRDSILSVSGRLDGRLFGPPVPVHLTDFMDGRGRPGSSGPLDGGGRRAIYGEVRRNFLSPLMLAFDAPIPHTTVGKRTVSNVPAQALILLNDPFVIDEATRWARRALSGPPDAPRERLIRLHVDALGRPPSPEEVEAALGFLERQGEAHGIPKGGRLGDARVWTDLCHVMLNLKEFIFLR